MSSLHELAHAKINLYLHVTGRRPADGYHLLDSLAVFAGAADRLELTAGSGRGGRVTLDIRGRFAAGLGDDRADNLIVRAGAVLRELVGADAARHLPDVAVVLHKELPVASGIGGLGRCRRRPAAAAQGMEAGRATGGPYGAGHAAGRGCAGLPGPACRPDGRNRGGTDPAPILPPCGMMLVNCGQSVSTPQVFRTRAPVFTPRAVLPPQWHALADMVRDLSAQTNDLQDAACALCPEITTVLSALRAAPGCRLARMSGSGATCFALFDSPAAARAAQDAVQRAGWWVWAGDLCRNGGNPAVGADSIPA
ncbi:4-(cytidine 5'-diphospho)-2-C-methyl-D-erythritol kinase [Komagataeibacter rhaeticus]|nr:4-(cytidine 5'-diphospho)-2-C-methyl-D-erythritol kinase [Komagataeibacter rhaeticus]